MITFKSIGHYGRLGNQMFQYAALLGIADKVGVSAGIDVNNSKIAVTVNYLVGPERLELLDTFPHMHMFEDSTSFHPNQQAAQKVFEYSPDFYDIPDNTDIQGYFQSEKYFTHIEDRIREEFRFGPDVMGMAMHHIQTATEDGKVPSTVMHVRRGDYTQIQDCHPLCPRAYYTQAYEDFCGGKIIVVSDDIKWVKENWDIPDAYYVDSGSQAIDMCIISLCDHCIIANSTFSWWGAWLNTKGGSVVAPSTWFGSKYAHYDISDLYPEGWKVI